MPDFSKECHECGAHIESKGDYTDALYTAFKNLLWYDADYAIYCLPCDVKEFLSESKRKKEVQNV